MYMNNNKIQTTFFAARYYLVLLIFFTAVILLLSEAVYLQYTSHDLLQQEGDNRQLRDVSIPVYRGMITDRNGKLLAVSIPAYAAFANPQQFGHQHFNIDKVARLLRIDPEKLRARLRAQQDKQFAYIKRQLTEEEADNLQGLGIEGVYLQREYRRLYPTGETVAHLVGVTDIDGVGIEGAEKIFNKHLQGREGTKRVLHDLYGRAINDIEMLETPHQGKHLALSIDQRIQYYAYRELNSAVNKHRAQTGSVLVMDVRSGEILAAANQPSFNPNARNHYVPEHRRNRILTDVFEPGSAIKPFIAAALLEHQYMDLSESIQTAPGFYSISGQKIKDIRNFGRLDLSEIIIKSSNVGISKAAMRLTPEEMWIFIQGLGFGQIPGTGFPGEAEGKLNHHSEWYDTDQAIMSYGYGITVSPLQLASAYAAIANDGWMPHPSLYKISYSEVQGKQVFAAKTAQLLKQALQQVVTSGTGTKARVPGFTTAGKTGTTRKIAKTGYMNEYISIFAGFAPVNNPAVVVVVVIDGPMNGEYYGGRVAAPVFSEVVSNTLRILNIPEDDVTGSYMSENIHYTWSTPQDE